MKILAIETSCDDTCAAVLDDDRVLSSVISSQTDLHREWGGVVPDIAKRAHAERIMPVIAQALVRAKMTNNQLPRNKQFPITNGQTTNPTLSPNPFPSSLASTVSNPPPTPL